MERWRRIDDASAADEDARALLAICCGATRWIDRMVGRRPFGTREAALASAHDEWFALSEDDWREAFGHHPRIGDREALRRRYAARDPAGREQSGVEAASAEVLTKLYGKHFDLTDRSHENRLEFKGKPRRFHSFYEMAFENASSRIALGVHYRMDCDEGTRLGLGIGKKVAEMQGPGLEQ